MDDSSSQHPYTETLFSLSHRKLLILYAWFIASESGTLKTMSTFRRILNRLQSLQMDYWPYIVGFPNSVVWGDNGDSVVGTNTRRGKILFQWRAPWRTIGQYTFFSHQEGTYIWGLKLETIFAFIKLIQYQCAGNTPVDWGMAFESRPYMLLQWAASYFLYCPLGPAKMNSSSTVLCVHDSHAEPSDWHSPQGSPPQPPWHATAINPNTA